MWNEEVYTRNKTAEISMILEDEESEEEEQELTLEEMNVLTSLHEEEMAPTQEQMDWMLLTEIKKERKSLANKYFPFNSNYKI